MDMGYGEMDKEIDKEGWTYGAATKRHTPNTHRCLIAMNWIENVHLIIYDAYPMKLQLWPSQSSHAGF